MGREGAGRRARAAAKGKRMNRTGKPEHSAGPANPENPAQNPLARNFTLGTLLKFAFPSIVMMAAMGVYTITDTIFVSRFAGTNALSALNIACPVINMTVGLGTMLAAGGSAVAAAEMGEGKQRLADGDVTLIAAAGAVLGIVLGGAGILFSDPMIRFLGANRVLAPYCREYLLTLLFFTPASMLQVLFQNLVVTAGKPVFGLVLSLCAGAVNLGLDYLFMVPLDMGIRGAALGTGLGYCLAAAAGTGFFLSGRGSLRFVRPKAGAAGGLGMRMIPSPRNIRPVRVLIQSCANGFSELVSQAAAAVTTFLFNITMMRLLGEDGVAAITILIYTQFFLTALYIGFSMGAAPVISYSRGAGNLPGLRRVVRLSLTFIGALSLLIFAGTMLVADFLTGIFSPKGTLVYELAREGFSIFPAAFLFCGINIFASAAFTALSKGKQSATLSLLRTLGLTAPGILLLPRILGASGIWLAVPLAEGLTMLLSIRLLLGEKRRNYGLGDEL